MQLTVRDLPWSLHTTSAPLGHKGVSDAKQIRDAGGIKLLHICPATNNLPTRMTRAAWATLCAATQRKARERECIDKNQQYLMRMAKRLNVCALCQGKTLPRGLEFIGAAEMAELSKPKEEAMAKQSKLGVCENCGDKGALTGSFGRRVCSTCLKIRSNVNSHLPKIATAARDMGKGQELLAALVPDGGGMAIQDMEAELLQEISGIVGYTGEDPAELVEAVRRATDKGSTVDCAECGAANDLLEIADLVGKRGASSGLVVEAVRGLLNEPWPPSGSQLNPDWVEWLMNFPIRWTSLSPVQKETFDDWKRKTQSQAASPESRVPRPVRKVQSASDGQASSRLHEAVGSGFALPRMPPEGARGVLEDGGHSGCSDTMGRRLERGHVRILREDFYEEATTGEDLFKVVREQTGMEASPWFMTEPADVPRVATGIAARVDRLKCIGNGQVPACAAEAWLRLFSRATGPQARSL